MSAFGANPAPSQLFYVPVPESDQLAAYTAINSAAVDPLNIFVTFSAVSDKTVIYYDHWEDGYERDITSPTQSTTQVFGDGNQSNGYPPGNAADLISAGTVFSLRNYVTSTQGSSVIKYDSRDKIASFKPISLTKTSFPASTSSLLAGCVEVFERGLWGTEYRVPVGSDMPTSTATTTLAYDADMFAYTSISVMAGAGGANVQIDANNDGVFEQNPTLVEGGSVTLSGVSAGARVLSDKPVQVVLFTGRPTSNYQSRDTSLLPTYRWSNSYYAPVSTPASYGTVVFLYNPGTSAITVSYDYRSSTTAYTTATVSVPAGGNARVTLAPASGTTHYGAYRFYTTGTTPPVFYAFCAVDGASASTGDNQAYDGGFTLVGQPSLTTQVLLSLGIGRDPNSTSGLSENGNPMWITTAGNGHTSETVYVDYNGDNAGSFADPNGNRYDVSYSLKELQQQKLFDPDGDQSGMLVYSLNPNVKIAAAWAQDPAVATAGQPGLDVSTLVPPLREGDGSKGSTLAIDADGDGYKSAGDTLEYDIRTINTARVSIVGPFTVKDTLPADLVYTPGTAKYRYSVGGGWQAWVNIPDDATGTAFPLDGSGFAIPGTLGVGQQVQVVFLAAIKTYANLTPGLKELVNTGNILVTPFGVTLDVGSSDPLYGSIGDRIWNDANGDGVQDAGEAGLNNVRVYIDTNNNGQREATEPTVLTAGNGNYVFNGLSGGSYVVRVDPATVAAISPGYGATYDIDGIATSYAATVTLASAQDRVDVDFGFRVGASVGDRVWVDRDADGVQEPGEPGINGVRVYVDTNNNGAFNTGEPFMLTSGDGNYYIGNLNPGSHVVRVDSSTLPAGASQTFDLNGGLDHAATVSLISAEHRADLDFGYRGLLSIGDLVWEDTNGNGLSLSSVSYNVNNGRIDINGDGSENDSDDGFIGTMRIINGYVDIDNDNSTPVDNDDDGSFLGVNIVNGGFDMNNSGSISNSGSNDDGTVTYSYNESGIASVRVYLDMNGDGIFNSTEPSAVTNSAGAYTIGNLFNGTYTVRVDTTTLPSSYVQTYDLTSPSTDHSATVVLSGSSRTDVDFGYRNDASIGDFVWNDRDADGVVDSGEPGIEGVIVYIDANSNGVFDQATERYSITNVNGYYLIDNLPAGSYLVRVDISSLPQGSTQTYDFDGTSTANRATRTLAISEDAMNVDFGYRTTASVGDFVWNDLDADGIQDAGESGISGVRVYLDINGNGSYDSATEPAATTDAAGAYTMANLVPGTYTARIDTSTLSSTLVQTFDAAGGLDHAATFSLSPNQVRTDVDFGYTTRVTIGDFVWNDTNANGQQDSGETGISGVTVTVFNAANDTIVTSSSTNASGAYSFTLMPGSYYLVFDKPAGYDATLADNGADATDSDANAATGRSQTITLAGGGSNVTLDAGFYQPSAIGDRVWNDTNANGQQDSGETGLDGITVTLYRPGFGADGIAGNSDDALAVATTTTSGGGAYSFTSLRPGTYQVNFGTLSGYNRTLADQGNDNSDSDANATTGTTANIVLAANATNNTVDAGYFQPSSVGNLIWNDINANGVQDSGETGLNGVTVTLYRPGFGADGIAGNSDDALAVATTTTSGGGAYSFTNLRPGTYNVNFGALSGYNRTLADQGSDDAVDSDANATTGTTANFTLAANATNNTIDAGYYQPSSIGNFVWNDTNANGLQDGGEAGLNGVTVTLYRSGFGADGIAGNSDDALAVASSTTSGGGAYSFTNLRPGTYELNFGTLAGYSRTLADQGGDDAVDSDANATTGTTATFALPANTTNNSIDAGYYQPSALGDLVWNDTNANGLRDSGETGLNGVTVTLYRPGFGADGIAGNSDDALAVATTTTSGGGAYSFSGLRPGTYNVNFGTLSGYTRTLADQGGDDTADSDASASTGTTGNIVLAANTTNTTVDAGYFQSAAIGNFVWNDANANGLQDGGETGLNGVTVTLYRPGFGADGIAGNSDDALAVATTTTSSGGAYSFTGLRPGTYEMNFGTLSGYGRTLADQGSDDAVDSDASASTGTTATFALAANATNNTIDAGYYPTSTLGDLVWNDTNANGLRDGGETGLNGVTVTLYRPGFGADGIAGNSDDALAVATTTTSGGGAYGFTSLRPGTYQVNFGILAGYARTLADQGGDDAVDSDASASTGTTGNIVLTAGATNNTIDAGYYQPATIGDFVWNDTNANGLQDSGETGLNGVTVTLYRPGFGADGIAGNSDDALAVATTTTSGGGAYSFTGLRPGTYQVNFGTLSGYNRTFADQGPDSADSDASATTGTTASFALAANATNSTVDAGYYQPGSISGTVLADIDNNNTGDQPISGVLLTLKDSAGNDIDSDPVTTGVQPTTTTTNASGVYSFGNLVPGTYRVVQTQPSGYLSVGDVDGADNNIIGDETPLTVAAGQAVTGRNFVEEQPGTVAGHLYIDANGNHIQDNGELDLPGVDVILTLSNGGTLTVTTNAGGNWSASVPPGTTSAKVRETDPDYPTGYIRTQGDDPTVSQAIAGTTVDGGTDGYFLPGSISGTVLADTDNDDIGDTPVSGVTLTLVDSFGNPVDGNSALPGVQPVTVTTASNGTYTFAGLAPGTYGVVETQPAGYHSISDKDGDNLDEIRPIPVTAGANNTGNDFVEEQPGSLSGTVLVDTDGDGDGDAPLSAVVIRLLDYAGDPVLDGLGAPVTTTTLTDGTYFFGGLMPGDYRVVQNQPVNYGSVSDVDGDNNNVIGDETPITVIAGNNAGGNDFVEIQLGTISGHVLLDTDQNGSGDSSLMGVTLNLLDGSGNPVLNGLGNPVRTTSGAGGFYSFTQVPVGTYRVSQTQPLGYGSVSDVDGANNNVIGDETPIVMTPALVVANRDFVEILLGSIAGSVLDDTDNDGIGDAPLANVTVTLLDGSGNPVDADPVTAGIQPVTLVTDVNGAYQFTDLFPGDYQVSQTQPSGYGSVSDVDDGDLDIIGSVFAITVAPGQHVTGRDFVEIRLGSISGYVHVGSSPITGVTLTLLDDHGDPVDGDPGQPGIQPITTVTDSTGRYVFTGVMPGDYRVAQIQPLGYDSFGDLDGGDIDIIGDITRITVLPGQENTDNNFVEIVDTCPDDWAQWKFQHPGEQAGGNPDADSYDNLGEFAFAMPADNGSGNPWLGDTAWVIRPSEIAPGTLEGVFVRPKGATGDVTYTLEYTGTLVTPIVWSSVGISSSVITVSDNGDCTETVTIHDLETLTGLTGGEGFVRVRADLDEDGDDNTDHTSRAEVEGWKETSLGLSCRTYGNPFLRETSFTGTVGTVNGQDIGFTASGGGDLDLSLLLAPGAGYYVEVVSGDNEGHRFDVVSATSSSLTLAVDSDLDAATAPFNTRIGALPANLAGDRIALRRHWTLGELFPASAFGGTANRNTADQVQAFADGQWSIYWLYDDGVSDPYWVKTGDNTYADRAATVLPPGYGLFFNNRTAATSILAYGEVRANQFIRPLDQGSNLVASGYPLDQSPTGATGREMTRAQGFFGSRDFATADSIYLWNGDATTGANGYSTYFLSYNSSRGVTKWAKVGDSSVLARDTEKVMHGNRSVFISSKDGVPAYTVPRPWTP